MEDLNQMPVSNQENNREIISRNIDTITSSGGSLKKLAGQYKQEKTAEVEKQIIDSLNDLFDLYGSTLEMAGKSSLFAYRMRKSYEDMLKNFIVGNSAWSEEAQKSLDEEFGGSQYFQNAQIDEVFRRLLSALVPNLPVTMDGNRPLSKEGNFNGFNSVVSENKLKAMMEVANAHGVDVEILSSPNELYEVSSSGHTGKLNEGDYYVRVSIGGKDMTDFWNDVNNYNDKLYNVK